LRRLKRPNIFSQKNLWYGVAFVALFKIYKMKNHKEWISWVEPETKAALEDFIDVVTRCNEGSSYTECGLATCKLGNAAGSYIVAFAGEPEILYLASEKDKDDFVDYLEGLIITFVE
jgi:hypothetical protein